MQEIPKDNKLTEDDKKVLEAFRQAASFRFADVEFKIQDGVLVSAEIRRKLKYR